MTTVVHCASASQEDKKWDGRWLEVLGDQNKRGADPPFVRFKESYFEWKDVRLPGNQFDMGPMVNYYDQMEDGEFANLADHKLEPNAVAVPKFSIMPANIVLGALEMQLTPREMYEKFVEFEQDKSDKVKDFLKTCKDWALAAAMQGAMEDKNKLTYILTSVLVTPALVATELKNRLEGNLGVARQPRPQGEAPTLS